MCACALYRWPHRRTYRAEIWHGGPHLPLGGIGYISFQYLYPQGRGRLKSGSGGPCWAPCNGGDGSGQTSPRCTAAGPIGPIVPLPFRLKFGREMGTYPGRSVPMFWLGSGAQIMGFQGTIWPNYEWFARVWMLQLAGALPLAQAL